MFDKFLHETLPKLEKRSLATGDGYVMFIFEKATDKYYSEKIRVFQGEIIYRHLCIETTTPEQNFNRLKDNLPGSVTLEYSFLRSSGKGAIIIIKATPADDGILDTIN